MEHRTLVVSSSGCHPTTRRACSSSRTFRRSPSTSAACSNSQARVKLLDVLTEGAKAVAAIRELRPDVVLVDALLQGRVKGPQLVEQIHEAELGVPVIVLTVPQNPIEPDPSKGIHGVLSMPFSGFDLMTRIA